MQCRRRAGGCDAQAGSTGRGGVAGASGEVNAGLADRLGAVLRVLCGCSLRLPPAWWNAGGGEVPGASEQ